MPILIQPQEMELHRSGEGWTEITLADQRAFGVAAMVAQRLSLEPGASGLQTVHGNVEQLLYVIRGQGVAVVGEQRLPLEPETMLWLEPGDRYQLQAGPLGLELLRGYAPGE